MTLAPHERLFVALDTDDVGTARRWVGCLRGRVGGFKIGLELAASGGLALVRELRDRGDAVFVDLKFHDIPNTVAGAAAAIVKLGASYFTLHATGGPRMIERGVRAAAEAAASAGLPPPTALVVTVLTNHDDDELQRIGLLGPCEAAVTRLAGLARAAGAGGLVCSARELGHVRRAFPEATLVVPGIRPRGTGVVAGDDQTRTATPAGAVALGADRLVVGRPITRAADPAAAAAAIVEELAGAAGS